MRVLIGRMICLLVALVVGGVLAVSAQDESGIPIHFAGHIQKVEGGTITINQIVIQKNQASPAGELKVGDAVVVDGLLHEDGTIAAQAIALYLTPPPTATTQPIETIALSGQVEAINRNVLTINGQTVIVAPPDNPVLSTLQVGDQVEITGQRVSGHAVALTVTKVETLPAVVVVEGNIQAIQANIVTVNDFALQFSPDDPLLPTLQVGDDLRIEGGYSQTSAGLVIQVASATVIAPAKDHSDR